MVPKGIRSWFVCFGVGVIVVFGGQGCSPKGPIVNSPIEPWEEEIVREKVAQREKQEEQEQQERLAQQRKDGLGKEKVPDEHSIIVATLADIMAFPVRGAAWLAHTIL